jgi:type IV secretory pathway TraG/TraD family ATPase VirD4
MRWLNAGISALVAFVFIRLFDVSLTVAACVFLAVFVVLTLTGSSFGGIWNSGLWTLLPVRRLVGAIADGAMFIATALFSWWLVVDVIDVPGLSFRLLDFLTHGQPDPALPKPLIMLLWTGMLLLVPFSAIPRFKTLIGKVAAPLLRLVRSRFVGMGGSSSFGGLFHDWAHPHREGQLLLGGSLYSPGWIVGRTDDRHFITIATSRSGKGRSAIIPNLLTWPGSALVIDPKGQNAAVTAAARGHGGGRVKKGLGQSVRIVDPFAELKAQGVDLKTHRFNPLTALDPAALDIVEQIRRLTDALVVPDPKGGESDFWDRSASIIIAGAVAHVLTGETVRPEMRNLYGVRDVLKNLRSESLRESMSSNRAAGGLAQVAVATLESLSEKAEGDVIGTALSHTDWLDSLAMKEALASEFSLSELKTGLCTVYLVLPPKYLDEHGRFLRLFVNLALQEASKGRKTRFPILMVLDEFYALGRLQFMATAAGLLAGYGVKLWPIVQNLGQIAELYPDNWETFLGNAGMWQVFAVNDQTTARYMSERLGEHIVWRKQRTFNQETQKYEEEWMPQGASFLRTGIELGRETSRDSGNQVIFIEGGDSFLLRRRPYDKTFKREQYSPDPSEPERSRLLSLRDWRTLWESGLDVAASRIDEWLARKAGKQ